MLYLTTKSALLEQKQAPGSQCAVCKPVHKATGSQCAAWSVLCGVCSVQACAQGHRKSVCCMECAVWSVQCASLCTRPQAVSVLRGECRVECAVCKPVHNAPSSVNGPEHKAPGSQIAQQAPHTHSERCPRALNRWSRLAVKRFG
eukprot:1161726-Pelagomonas_calceolata.AAC.11